MGDALGYGAEVKVERVGGMGTGISGHKYVWRLLRTLNTSNCTPTTCPFSKYMLEYSSWNPKAIRAQSRGRLHPRLSSNCRRLPKAELELPKASQNCRRFHELPKATLTYLDLNFAVQNSRRELN